MDALSATKEKNAEGLQRIAEPLDLKQSLKKCGAAKLANIVGIERLENISSILGGRITESQIAEIIMIKFGSQILANRDVRECLLETFNKDTLVSLLDDSLTSEHHLTPSDIQKLRNAPWKRGNVTTIKWLGLFDLTDDYLPPIKEKIPSFHEIKPDTILYPYQKRVKDRFIKFLLSDQRRILLHMPTGAGKTRTSIEGLVDYWRALGTTSGYMVWLTDSEELCTQAEETFEKLWVVRGDRPLNLVRLWGSHKIDSLLPSGGLIIASLQKLHSLRKSSHDSDFRLISEIYKRCQLVLVDEAHKSIAPTYKATIEFLCDIDSTKLVGLTATPGRTNDDQIDELVQFYDNNKITLTDEYANDIEDPIAFLQENQYLSQITRKKVNTDLSIDLTPAEQASISDFYEIPQRILLELSKNDQRNAIIVKEIADLNSKDFQTIVFACSVEHAHLISELLMIRGIKSRCVDGGTPAYDRIKYVQEYKQGNVNVLVNYGVLTTGFDAPNTNAVVITRPTGSLVLYSQMIGRGIRGPKMGGTEDCILIDLEDNLQGYPSERQAFKFFDNYWSE